MNKFDIYWADFDYEENDGQSKRRPVLLLDVDIILPIAKITSKEIRTNKDYEIKKWQDAGLDKESVIRFDKIMLVMQKDLKEEDYIGHLSEEDIKAIKEKKLVESLVESIENDFWHLRDLKEPKYGTGNLIVDGGRIRPLTKKEVANKFAVSIEHADKGDLKTKKELIDFANTTDAEKIMFFFMPGDNYSGEYSFLYSDEDKVRDIWKKYKQYSYAKYDEDGEFHEVTESLTEAHRDDEEVVELTKTIKDSTKRLNDLGINTARMVNDAEVDYALSLGEDIEKHETLNDKIFNVETQEMLPEVREKLLEIANNFIDAVHEDNLDLEVKDIVLIGSNANYNYTKDSDLDVHIIASSKPDCNKKHLNQIYQAYKSLFNSKYDIYIHNIPTEIYVEMDDVNAMSGGIYSIKDNKWLKQPKQFEIPDIDYDAFYREFERWEERYFELVNYLDEYDNALEEVSKYIDDIYEARKSGVAEGGEWNLNNLVFKEIRNRGYLDLLKELKTELASKEMSLESIDKQESDVYNNTQEDLKMEEKKETLEEASQKEDFDMFEYAVKHLDEFPEVKHFVE